MRAIGFTGLRFLVAPRKLNPRTSAVRTRGSARSQFVECYAPMPTRRWFESMRVLRTRLEVAIDASKGSDSPTNSPGPGVQKLGASKEPKKPKRSTEPGEAQVKIVSAFSAHHRYENGVCLNMIPIGNNELARAAEVSQDRASAFFKDKFGSHGQYKALCHRDPAGISKVLKALNGDYAIDDTYGDQPPGECEIGDDD
jgi:hypothetical protein